MPREALISAHPAFGFTALGNTITTTSFYDAAFFHAFNSVTRSIFFIAFKLAIALYRKTIRLSFFPLIKLFTV
jgi:hypothetical protein